MAVRYAVATGNWSDTATWNGGTLPTSADDVYSNNFTVTIDQDVTVLSIRNTAAPGITAGNGFVCSTSQTINLTATVGIVGTGNFHVLTWNGGSEVTTNVNAVNIDGYGSTSFNAIRVQGTGILNITSNIRHSVNNAHSVVFIESNCTVNVVGDLFSFSGGANSISGSIIRIQNGNLNFIGNYPAGYEGSAVGIRNDAGNATINITGNLINSALFSPSGFNSSNRPIVSSNQSSTINITGNLSGYAVGLFGNSYLNHIGVVEGFVERCIQSTSNDAINILTGPFICSETGVTPFNIRRMHYFRTVGSYFEFRDETTNGALPPASPSPSARLVNPDTFPITTDVRDGILYGSNTLVGTLKVPPPDTVAKGVPTDNTVGTAMLKPEDVWDYATANLTDPNSIGARLKNVSTVDTTGEQLEALL